VLGSRAKDEGQSMAMFRFFVGARVFRVAEIRNLDALTKAAGMIDSVCQDCHASYRDHGTRKQRKLTKGDHRRGITGIRESFVW
jgi:hypothetical protein